MDPARRLEYLRALGIDVWLPRHVPGMEPPGEAGSPQHETAGHEAAMAVRAPAVAYAVPEPPAAPPAQARTEPPPLAPSTEELLVQWRALQAEVSGCTRCGLHATRTQTVFGVGHPHADWLVVGEAPGAEEDRRGEPFVGRAGQLLDAMLHAIGLSRRENVYVANTLKCRPPGNREPKPDELACCLPYLNRQIALIQPRLILAVGRIAAQNLLATDAPLARLRGRVHRFGELNTPLVVTYHPAYLLRTPGDKRKAWEDLKFARSVYRQLSS